jgi:hypothetical protein
MKFEYKHTFDVPVETLIESMFHPDLPPVLTEKMTTVVSIEVLERQETDRAIERRVKYTPVPMIKKIGTKTITPESMVWIEQSTFDKQRQELTFANVPDHPKIRAKMTNEGQVTFRDLGGGRSERVMSGTLKIKFPILGRVAEGVISKNAKKMLDEEAAVLAEWMKGR